MPALANGKTPENVTTLKDFTNKVLTTKRGMIAGSRYYDKFKFHDMSNVTVTPDAKGDDMFMVNYHNGMSYTTSTPNNLLSTLTQYMTDAINMHSSSKATVLVKYNTTTGLYELDNMRTYPTEEEARRNGYTNRSEYVYSVGTGKCFPI